MRITLKISLDKKGGICRLFTRNCAKNLLNIAKNHDFRLIWAGRSVITGIERLTRFPAVLNGALLLKVYRTWPAHEGELRTPSKRGRTGVGITLTVAAMKCIDFVSNSESFAHSKYLLNPEL